MAYTHTVAYESAQSQPKVADQDLTYIINTKSTEVARYMYIAR